MLSDEQLTTIVAEASVGLHFGPTQAEFTERVRGACEAALDADRAERGKGRPSDEEIKAKWHEIWLGPKYLGHASVECAIDFAHWVADRCQSVSEEKAEPHLDRGPAREEEQAVGHARKPPRHAQTHHGSRASCKHVSRVLARAVLEIADVLDITVYQDVHRIALGQRCKKCDARNRRAEANWKAWS